MSEHAAKRAFVGVDGCRAGWLCVSKTQHAFDAWISPDIASALARAHPRSLLGIDIPIGLAVAGPRRCDDSARQFLGWPRRCSVFSAPVRGALQATEFEKACKMHRKIDGRGITRQAFGLFKKLRDVDEFLRSHPDARARILEVHPEVSFALWAGRPMAHGKKSKEGRAERTALIERRWPGLVHRLLVTLPKGGYAQDDLLDAIAALWSTMRHAGKSARRFPIGLQQDEHGLRMQIIG